MKIWSFDPGETVGVFKFNEACYHFQIEYARFATYLHGELETADENDALPSLIIVEQTNIYDRRASKARKNLLPTIEVQGYIVMMAQLYGVPTKYQWNRDKNKVTDEALAERGMLATPKTKWRHANDAARHYVYHLSTTRKEKQ